MQDPSLEEGNNMPNCFLSPGVPELKATFPFLCKHCGYSKLSWSPAQWQVPGARHHRLLGFSPPCRDVSVLSPSTLGKGKSSDDSDTSRRGFYEGFCVACETQHAQKGLLNHQVAAPTVKCVHELRFQCTS